MSTRPICPHPDHPQDVVSLTSTACGSRITLSGCFNACVLTLFALLLPTGNSSGQDSSSSGYSFDSSTEYTTESGVTTADHLYGQPQSDTVSQASYTPGGVDLLTEVADLQIQMQSQANQIESLRHQLGASSMRQPARSSAQWFASYESVLVAPMQDNSTGVIVETDEGYSHVGFPWELEHSPRVQFGREAEADSLGWRVRFWEFRHGEDFDANDTNGLLPTGYEGTVGYVSEDGDITTGIAFIQEGTFLSTIRTDVIDFEMQRNIARPLDLYAGIRYAKVGQSYSAITDQGNATARSEFRGLGPTVALRLNHVLPYERLALFTNVRGSMLFGSKSYAVGDNVNNVVQSVGEIDLRSGSDSADTLAGNAEIQLGIRYEPCEYFNISVAIEGQHFANVGGPNPSGVFTGADSGLASGTPIDDGLGFLGLTVGTEVRW
ncbi:hypothetical protein Pla22_28570 [Rubripirellula amarantea]|uniref:Uncharacterized protein n=1 Tax=Rubripirellula amarantea TaxID=2527999 RepID=A0A5C5WZ65_9BACT|nr:Lpg1974 family pore-forming outer membrane protein [Rubripirellula amarantea]TWT55202.1 hypothetical protein Pla22_28570 [Rubripirellula amarantea]